MSRLCAPARPLPVPVRRFALSVLASEILRDVAVTLQARGIPVMPLKGVLFQRLLYADPTERLLSDVDVLVPESEFEVAIQALRDASFCAPRVGRSLVEVALRSPKGLDVDLHRRLFSPARYRLETDAVFRRATRDDRLLGVPLYIAHPLDTAAHLIGKFVSDHVVADSLKRLRELLLWVEHCDIQPEALASHLDAHGLSRAARYALGCGNEVLGNPFFSATLAALPPDPIGRACAHVARSLMPRWRRTPLAAAPSHLLNDSIFRASASAFWSAFNRWQSTRYTVS
ncbi:MAG TPA: nucleotidyltransferase family protein [Polyangiaceae bacterium]|nr:nucleotidyltransferase family protein [Polyangiaceae bacterium]